MTSVTDGSQMEASSDKIVESAPCRAVKMEAEANTTNKIEETKYGLDEVEEEDENEGDDEELYSSEGVENEDIEDEEIENENINNEEIEYEDEENQEVTADFNNKYDDEEYVEENEKVEEVVTNVITEEMDSKEVDRQLQSLVADVIEAGKDEVEEAVKDSATEDSIPGKKAKTGRRKTTTNATVSKKAVKAGGKVGSGFVSEEKDIEKNDGTVKSITLNLVPRTKNTEVGNVREGKEVADGAAEKVTSGFAAEEKSIKKDDGTVKSITQNLVPKTKNNEVVNGEKGKEVMGSTAEEIIPIKKAKQARRKTTINATTSEKTDKADDAGKKEASAVVKEVKRVDGMGIIFMCNAKTKQDCFRFKVLGLPASQKELVTKIYTGMRLFLFDVDLKLMYGIFKAVTPGGYNIEPKAFNSAYPAQVRFKVFDDCLPLPEEKFKAALKENYYGRNKFNNQLSQQQVKKLCNLFEKTNKNVKRKRPRADIQITEPVLTPASKRLRTRARRNDAFRSVRAEPKPIRGRVHNNTRKAREPIRMEPVHQQSRTHHHSRSQHGRSGRRTPPAPLPSRRDRSPPLRQRRESPPPHSSRAQDMDPYRRHRDAYVSSAPSAAAPYDYYYRHEAPPIDHRAVPRDMQASEYGRDAYSSMYEEPPRSHYLDAYYASSFAAAAAVQPAYGPLPPQAAYAPPLHEHVAYGGHPFYYRY